MEQKKIQVKRRREKNTVYRMISMYCHGNHGSPRGSLCTECQELAEYASERVDKCPYMETKTFCSGCKTHCYKPQMRERIRKVMRWSGPRMIFCQPIIAIQHILERDNHR